MTLLEYVVKNDKEIPYRMKAWLKSYDSAEEAILDGYCPSAFKILIGTEYANPRKRKKDGDDKYHCKYSEDSGFYEAECKKCWNRKILVSK